MLKTAFEPASRGQRSRSRRVVGPSGGWLHGATLISFFSQLEAQWWMAIDSGRSDACRWASLSSLFDETTLRDEGGVGIFGEIVCCVS